MSRSFCFLSTRSPGEAKQSKLKPYRGFTRIHADKTK
jgi:hypothetical protein